MARRSITIVFELDEATDSPSGCARLPDGTARCFHGWLGLAEVINTFGRPPQTDGAADRQPTREENLS